MRRRITAIAVRRLLVQAPRESGSPVKGSEEPIPDGGGGESIGGSCGVSEVTLLRRYRFRLLLGFPFFPIFESKLASFASFGERLCVLMRAEDTEIVAAQSAPPADFPSLERARLSVRSQEQPLMRPYPDAEDPFLRPVAQ